MRGFLGIFEWMIKKFSVLKVHIYCFAVAK